VSVAPCQDDGAPVRFCAAAGSGSGGVGGGGFEIERIHWIVGGAALALVVLFSLCLGWRCRRTNGRDLRSKTQKRRDAEEAAASSALAERQRLSELNDHDRQLGT
jgi:type VI protein secretion system component VasK